MPYQIEQVFYKKKKKKKKTPKAEKLGALVILFPSSLSQKLHKRNKLKLSRTQEEGKSWKRKQNGLYF
jgi:hypothetical protein